MSFVLESIPGALSKRFTKKKFSRIDINGTIDRELATRVLKQLEKAIQSAISTDKCIFIFIHSNGGSVYEAFRIIDAIRRAKMYCTVATVIDSIAFSGALCIFCAGDDGFRFVSEEGQAMIHQPIIKDTHHDTDSMSVHTKSKEGLEHLAKIRHCLEEGIISVIKDRDTQENFIGHMNERCNVNWFLDARELVDFGIANYMGVPDFLHQVTYQPSIILNNEVINVPPKDFLFR